MTIALINEAEVEAPQLRIAVDQVDRIWAAEGVVLSWVDHTWRGEGALTVVIQQGLVPRGRGPLDAWRDVLGAIPVHHGQALSRITVSLGSIRGLLKDAMVQGRPLSQRPQRFRLDLEAQALGRVIAHEVGHYRLRFYAHTATGLMRPVFTTNDLLTHGVSGFRLDRSVFHPAMGAGVDRTERVDCRR